MVWVARSPAWLWSDGQGFFSVILIMHCGFPVILLRVPMHPFSFLTLTICIEITNQTCLHDSKVQNTTLKGVQTALLYITVWVAENAWTFRKHKPNLFWFFLLFVCLYHHLSNTQRIHVHDPFMHAFTQEENTPTAKWVRDEGKVGYLPLPEGCWNLGRQDCAN